MSTNKEDPKVDVSEKTLTKNNTPAESTSETPAEIAKSEGSDTKHKVNDEISKTEENDENIDTASVDSFGSNEVAREQSKYKDDKIEDIEALAQEMEECYLEAVGEMKELEDLLPRFKALDEKTQKLFKYYFGGPWMSHRERIFDERPNSGYNVIGEDCIYDFFGDMQNLAKQNLKEATLYLTEKKEF